jgi:hypothetical protein
MYTVFSLFFNKYKTEIIIGSIVVIVLGYIGILKMELKSTQNEFNEYKVNIQKNNLEYYKKIKEKEDEFKDYQHQYDLKTAKEKTTIIEKVRTEIKVIRIDDSNKTITPLDSNCSNQLKGKLNEKNSITRSI